MQTEQSDLAIVICTFHREALLAKALASVCAQQHPEGLRVSVIVVDNSDEGTAAETVAVAARRSPFDLSWIAAHPANISAARNAGVAAAQARYIAFLDDDQEMAAGWLAAVATALAEPRHDVLFGAVVPVFEAPERATPLTRQLFSRQLAAPAGQALFAMGPDKTRGVALATNNSIFRRSVMALGPAPFDIAFGHGGGEDYDLLCRMQQRGCRFGWLPEAQAREFVPAARCAPAYLRRRFFAGGQAFAAAVANASPNPARTRWLLRLRAAAQALVLAARLPLCALGGRMALTDYSYLWAGVLGKLSFSDIYPIYRHAAGQKASSH